MATTSAQRGVSRDAGRRRSGVANGLRRFPLLTAVVFAVTAATSLAQLAVPGMLDHLQRTPAGLHGEWWRTATSLFVQDGGTLGTVSNLLFLAVIGAIAEQILSRPAWLAHYFGVGLLTELIAYAWQPVGGGNSIAICGLTGAVAVAAGRADERLPDYAPQVLLIWSSALLATLSTALYVPIIILAAVAAGLVTRRQTRRQPILRPTALTVGATALVLTIAANIHGAALVVGGLLALLTMSVRFGSGDPVRARLRP